MLKNGKSANCNEYQNRETEVFWHKNRKPDLKNSQNCKTENPNALLVIQSIKRCLCDSECHFTFRYRNALLKYSTFFFFNNMHGKNLKPTKPKRTSIFVSYRVCSLVSVMNYVSGLSSREEWVFLRERYPPPAPDFPAPIKKRKKFINSRDLLVAFIS